MRWILLAVFVMPAAMAVTTSTGVANLPPVIAAASLSNLASGALTPSAGSTTSSTVTITVTDDNGYQDIRFVNVTVRTPAGAVHRATAPATLSSGTLLTATYTASFTMQYHDAAALGASTYKVEVTATDRGGAVATAPAAAVFNYQELAAVSTGPSLALGTGLAPGATTAAAALTLSNTGNVALDAQLSGTSLTHATEAASIPVGKVRWAYASNMANAAALTGSPVTATAFNLAPGAGAAASLHFTLDVPSGSEQWIPEGDYTGTLTVGGIKG